MYITLVNTFPYRSYGSWHVVWDEDDGFYLRGKYEVYVHQCTVQTGARLMYMVRAGTTWQSISNLSWATENALCCHGLGPGLSPGLRHRLERSLPQARRIKGQASCWEPTEAVVGI